jgi:hypothetical protein
MIKSSLLFLVCPFQLPPTFLPSLVPGAPYTQVDLLSQIAPFFIHKEAVLHYTDDLLFFAAFGHLDGGTKDKACLAQQK